MNSARSIGVLAGGDSPEREVSLVSGRHACAALQEIGHNARLITIDTLDDLVVGLLGVDVVFNCLHGGTGEDGTVQLLLDVMEIPYAGSGAQACARAMDKAQAKSIFTLMGVPTPPWQAFHGEEIDGFLEQVGSLTLPVVVKPIAAGSTIGVHIVRDPASLRDALESVTGQFGSALVETYIPGRELTVGVLRLDGDDRALPVVEIRCPDGFFDYTAKYTDGVSEFLVPADLDPETSERVQAISLRAHEILGCFGFSRIDLRLGEDGIPYVLEVNTLPGMTPMSDLPRAAAAAGISYVDLVEAMLKSADERGAECESHGSATPVS